MTYPNLHSIARSITTMTSALHGGHYFEEEAARLHGMEATFDNPAVRGAQFAFELFIEGMDEPLDAYAVVKRAETGFDLILTRDEDYLEKFSD